MLVAHGCRINPVDEEGKARSPEKMTELVHEAHQAHTRKALKALKVSPPPAPRPSSCLYHAAAVVTGLGLSQGSGCHRVYLGLVTRQPWGLSLGDPLCVIPAPLRVAPGSSLGA